jgi:hypothetical protein
MFKGTVGKDQGAYRHALHHEKHQTSDTYIPARYYDLDFSNRDVLVNRPANDITGSALSALIFVLVMIVSAVPFLSLMSDDTRKS